MGYDTYFKGEIIIKPPLPHSFIIEFLELKEGRNNTYGDGHAYSFDAVVHGKIPKPGTRGSQIPKHDFSKVPSCWCNWELHGLHQGATHTSLRWDEGEKFYEYGHWLQFCIDFIYERYPKSKFTGEIEWYGYKESGTMQITEYLGNPRVMMIAKMNQHTQRCWAAVGNKGDDPPHRGEYVLVKLPERGAGVMERIDAAILPEDGIRGISSLRTICLDSFSLDSFQQARQLAATIPDLLAEIDTPTRFCSGCGGVFRGPTAVIPTVQTWYGSYSGLNFVERFCSVECSRIPYTKNSFDDSDSSGSGSSGSGSDDD